MHLCTGSMQYVCGGLSFGCLLKYVFLTHIEGSSMRNHFKAFGLGIALTLSAAAFAQSPGPATTTKPGPSSTVPNPMGTTSREASPGLNAKPMEVPKSNSRAAHKMPETEAPGGGAGKVWVNTASKTYHCAGTKYYGKTKAGEYMSEADAKAKGNHADHKKACS